MNNITGVFFLVKRLMCVMFSVALLLVCTIGRIGCISLSGDYTVSSGYNSYTLTVTSLKQTIYDRNMRRMNNNQNSLVAVIRPTQNCLSELNKLFSQMETEEIVDELSQGYPVVRKIDSYANCQYIKIMETKETALTPLLKLVQKEYGEVVYEQKINFGVDAVGRLLEGDEGETAEEYNTEVPYGVQLTVDSRIQQAVEDAAKYMRKGAVVVMDVNTADILALYCAPDDNMLRAVMPYTVGSVFKLVVSSCAIENGIDISYNCTGNITVGDTVFSCQKEKAHGQQHMREALANSCNCFFVKLALQLGADKVLKTARAFGFGGETRLMENDSVSDGNLPDENDLSSKGQLALLGFGQGLLTSTPLHFCTALCALSNGGVYREPRLVAGTVDINEDVKETGQMESKRVISEETSKILRSYMRYVVTNGTGSAAEYNDSSAGKTSTAQSGIYKDGREVLNTWFAGIYPYDDPKYAIVVMTEDGTSGSSDCCPIFRTIVESIS